MCFVELWCFDFGCDDGYVWCWWFWEWVFFWCCWYWCLISCGKVYVGIKFVVIFLYYLVGEEVIGVWFGFFFEVVGVCYLECLGFLSNFLVLGWFDCVYGEVVLVLVSK